MTKPFIVAKAVKKEAAEKVRDEIETYYPLVKVSINKRKDESWSIYCAGVNSIAVKKDEIIKFAQSILQEFELRRAGGTSVQF